MIRNIHSGEWTLLDEQGNVAVAFTSFVDMEFRNEGQALSYPVESGGFAGYNKTQSPLSIRLTLGVQGTEADFGDVLRKLDMYKIEACKLSVSTPSTLYENMTLESYTYKRGREENAGMLTVGLSLVEVREAASQGSSIVLTRPKNPTSSRGVNTGKKQPVECYASVLGVSV